MILVRFQVDTAILPETSNFHRFLLFCLLSDLNGGMNYDGNHSQSQGERRKPGRNYKLIMDPQLGMGGQKVYRFEGVNPEVCIVIPVLLKLHGLFMTLLILVQNSKRSNFFDLVIYTRIFLF